MLAGDFLTWIFAFFYRHNRHIGTYTYFPLLPVKSKSEDFSFNSGRFGISCLCSFSLSNKSFKDSFRGLFGADDVKLLFALSRYLISNRCEVT